jgi:ribosomal protein S18 acetylase RimI-like enzyme
MSVKIEYASEARLVSYHKTIHQVAQERIYLQMVSAPPFERLKLYQMKHLKNNWPAFFAIDREEVVGWIEITPLANLRLAHRATLSMGVLGSYRRQGIGKKLLRTAIDHAKKIGIEKIELYVYTTNLIAIDIYQQFGFQQSGYISHYRKLDGEYFDCLFMDLNLRV